MGRRTQTIAEIRQRFSDGHVGPSELRRLACDERSGVQKLIEQQRQRKRRHTKELRRVAGLLAFERELWAQQVTRIAGVDEVGAGPLAGPVVAAAVILPPGCSFLGIDDSKKLSRAQRESLATQIYARASSVAIAACSSEEIDEINILQASRQAMRRAVGLLKESPDYILVDARRIPNTPIPQKAIIDGDAQSQSIAAASIVAKVFRDNLMTHYASLYPGYGFERHNGYATAQHLAALRQLGPTPIHRYSFSPVSGRPKKVINKHSKFSDGQRRLI